MSLIADIHRDLEKGALQLLVEYRDRLLSEALKLCGDAARAEDLVFLTIERVLAKSDSYRTDENLFGWMKTIMENLYLNEEKRPDNRRVKIVDPNELEGLSGLDFSAEERILRNSDGEAVRAALGKLDPKDREILVMRFYEDLTLEQIAACLNCPTTSVWRRIQVAIKLLSGKLNAEVKAKKPLAILSAFLLAGSLFGAVTWGIVETVNAVGSLGSEVALESEEPEAALESEGTLGSLESEGPLGSVADPVDPNPDPIVSNVPNPDPIVPKDSIPAEQISTTENTSTKEKENMNLKSIIKSAAKLTVGAALTTGLAATAQAETYYCFATDTSGENFNGNYWASQSGGTTATGHTPTAGNTYVVESCCPKGGKARGGRIPANYTLPEGAKLVFQMAENPLDDTTPAYISLQGGISFTASDVTVMSGVGGFAQTTEGSTGTVNGNIDVRSGAELDFITWNGCQRYHRVNAAITGEGTICLCGAHSSAAVGFSGSLAGFKGRFRFDKAFNDGNASAQRPLLAFDTQASFPGDPDELDARSIDLSDGAGLGQRTVMKFNAEGSLGATRGVYVGENGSNPPVIYVEAGIVATINGPLSGSAGFIKQGNGILYLADACKDLTGTVVIEAGSISVAKDFSAPYSEKGGVMNTPNTYYNLGSDSGKQDFFTADIWSLSPGGAAVAGHHPPMPGNTYVIEPDHGGRLYATRTFAGGELVFQESESPKGTPGFISFAANSLAFTVPKMTVKSGIGGFAMAVNSIGTVNGNVEVCAGAELLFRTWNGCDRHFAVNAAITGEGTICLQGAHASASTTLNGSLADFTGGFRFDRASNTDQSSNAQRPQLIFNTEESFPGDPDELEARSIDLSDGAGLGQRTVVKFNAEGSLGATRGVYVGENGNNPPVIYVEAGKTVTIEGPLSGSAGLIKEGAGDLILSSATTTLIGTVTVRGGVLWYTVQPEGCVFVEDGGAARSLALPSIMASLTGYTKTAAELQVEKHVMLDITEPAGGFGCTLRWSHDGMNWSETEPQFAEPGFYTVYCKVSAEGYLENVLCARVEVALSADGDTAFVAPSGASDPVSPYDTPATAANSLSVAAGAGKSKIVVASGRYDLWASETIGGVQVFGPSDRSAVFARSGLVLGSGTMLSGITFDGVDGALDVNAGAVVSNCCVKGGQEPVLLGGLMTDCTVCDFSGGAYGICAASGAACVRSQILRGHLTKMDSMTLEAPIIGTGSGFVTVTDCTIGGNTVDSQDQGAGAFGVEGTLVVNRCRVVDNSARFAVSRNSGRIAATNSLFTGNLARTGFCYGEAEFVNCTIANNIAPQWGFYSKSQTISRPTKTAGYFKLVNTIVANNTFGGNTQTEVFNPDADAPYGPFDHSLFPYATEMAVGAGNIDANETVPDFLGTGDDPYQLNAGSAGLNAGSPLGWTKRDVDLLHNRRVSGTAVDMGCYERVSPGMMILIK